MLTLVNRWLDRKRRLSREAANPMSELPAFASLKALADYLRDHFIYTGDRMMGLQDLYNHPGEVNHWIAWNIQQKNYGENRKWPLRVDCDDVSAFVYLAAKKIPGVKKATMLVFYYPTPWVMIKELARNLIQRRSYALYFHEACMVEMEDGAFYIVDASGRYMLFGEDPLKEAGVLVSTMFDSTLIAAPIEPPFEA